MRHILSMANMREPVKTHPFASALLYHVCPSCKASHLHPPQGWHQAAPGSTGSRAGGAAPTLGTGHETPTAAKTPAVPGRVAALMCSSLPTLRVKSNFHEFSAWSSRVNSFACSCPTELGRANSLT